MKTYYLAALVVVLTACGGGAADPHMAQLIPTTDDAGIGIGTGGDAGSGGGGGDAGVVSKGCMGSIAIAGLVSRTDFNLAPKAPTSNMYGNCYMAYGSGSFVLTMIFPEGLLSIGQPTFQENNHQVPHGGTAFSLSDPPGPGDLYVVWTPNNSTARYENRDGRNSYTEPSTPGTAAITYTGTAAGDPIRIDISGPVTPDMGATYINLEFHVVTAWQ